MNFKNFTFKYLLLLTVIGIIFLPFYLFIKNAHEHDTFNDIVRFQLKNNGVYGTALNQNTFRYKLALVEQAKPEIIAVGSSRVMKFREEFFKPKFINTGGATNNLIEGKMFIEEMLKLHKPKAIIFGLDFRWFNKNIIFKKQYAYHDNTGDILTFDKMISKPLNFLLKKKISIDQFISVIKSNKHINKHSIYSMQGLDGIINDDGFAPDGSRFDGKYLFNYKKSHDIKLAHTINEIDNSINTWTYGEESDFHYYEYLTGILEVLKKNNIKVYLFITPVAPGVSNHLDKKTGEYGYISKLRSYITDLGGVDLHDFRIIDKNDCEFLDGYHGGDLIYQRILLHLTKKYPSLSDLIETKRMKILLEKYKGATISNINNEISTKDLNQDVMELGCPKVYN